MVILDATAGNRSIYRFKHSDNIIYLDRCRELYIKPTIYGDDTMLPFRDKVFDTIIFDPPHFWRRSKTRGIYDIPYGSKTAKAMGLFGHTYYGNEQYKTKTQLLKYIHEAQREFHRVLKDDGILLFKWSEVEIPLEKILTLFRGWNVLMVIPVKSPLQTRSECATYWVMLEKRKAEARELTQYT
jgi:SAM-dependent methyltransferase